MKSKQKGKSGNKKYPKIQEKQPILTDHSSKPISDLLSLESTPSGQMTPQSKNSANIKYIRKHEFIDRPSILDDYDERSQLKQNLFMGFYNCLFVVCFFYFVTNPILRKKEKGEFIDTQLYDVITNDFFMVVVTWPLYYLWSHIAYLLQLLTLYNMPRWLLFAIQHSSQSFMFLYSHYLVVTRNWCLTHAAFVTFQSCVFFMKMHSYTMTNQKLREQWISNGKPQSNDKTQYPNNVNIKDFTLYLWFPVLVYETSYPRTNKIRIWYVIRKIIYTFSMLLLDYQIASIHVIPMIQNRQEMSLVQSICSIVLPMAAIAIITFNLIFENYLNFFAEITYFADRLFYQDWWNSTSFEEFNRKWNKPVHEFLYRHVYIELIFTYNVTVTRAQLLTFLFSALLHEYTLAVMLQKIQPILILFMLIQIPVMLWTKNLKGTQVGNQFWWWGIIQGTPLILNLYLRIDEIIEKGFSIII